MYYPSKSLIVSWNSVVHCFLTLNGCSRHENTAMAQAPKLEANPNLPRGRASPLHSAGERQAWGTPVSQGLDDTGQPEVKESSVVRGRFAELKSKVLPV